MPRAVNFFGRFQVVSVFFLWGGGKGGVLFKRLVDVGKAH